MNLQQLSDEMGFDPRTFLVFDGFDEEPSDKVRVMYPNYMEAVDFSTKPREVAVVLHDLEDIMVEFRKHVNKDIKLIRKKIKEIEAERRGSL